jgi:hypothetical protein
MVNAAASTTPLALLAIDGNDNIVRVLLVIGQSSRDGHDLLVIDHNVDKLRHC